MSQGDGYSSDEGGEVRDSRLESFLRQASAIIAAEKGLTNAAKAKLEDLAGRIHLPDELFSIGLQRLQDSNAPIGNLTAYERGFLKFLVNEFSRMPAGTVLSISMEQKAIAHAKNRFDIPSHRAEQLIEHQTRAFGFGRLSRSDAREFGRQSILDHIGDKPQLDEKTKERVFRLGRRWGFTGEEVSELVDTQLRENVRYAKVQRRRPAILALAMLVCVGSIAVGLWWLYENRERIFSPSVTIKEVETSPADTEPVVDLTSKPDPEPVSELEKLFPGQAKLLFVGTAKQRMPAFDSLFQQFLESPTQESAKVAAIVEWYLTERDPVVANRLVEFIGSNISARPRTDRNQQLQWPYRVVSLAVAICDAELTSTIAMSRKESIQSVVRNRIDLAAADSLSPTSVKAATARRQWNHLNQDAFNDPARTSILIQPLANLTLPMLEQDQLHDFLSRSVRSVLSADESQWINMKGPIESAIKSADEVQRMEWIGVWLDKYDGSRGFRELTAPMLAEAIGKELPRSSADVEAMFRSTRSSWRNRLLRPALTRHRKLNERIQKLLPLLTAANDETLPELVFRAAQLANICLESSSIIDAGRAGDDSAWDNFDAMFGRLDQRLIEFVFLDEVDTGQSQPVSSAGFDTTARDRDLGVFADTSASNQPRRLAAIERLPKLIERFESIPTLMAEDLAQYLTSPIDSDEWLKMQRVVPGLAKWPRVLLAISDRLPQSTAAADQTVTLCNLLTGEVWQGEKSTDWKVDLSRKIFLLADEVLRTEEFVNRSASGNDWLRVEKFLQSAYRQRCKMLGDVDRGSGESVFELAAACVQTGSVDSRTKTVVSFIDSVTDNEVEKVILLNRLLTSDGSTVSYDSKTVGESLLDSEVDLMRMWLGRFNRQIAEIVDEG